MGRGAVLITGASGEIGHGLIHQLAEEGAGPILALDVRSLPEDLKKKVHRELTGSILDVPFLDRILAEYKVEVVFHLAALLSTRGEMTPKAAHQVNVEGTLNLLEFAQKQGENHGQPVVFVYPSSIAVYGLPDLPTKEQAGKVQEDQFLKPITMYGCNKLYCEHLGRYYSEHYRQLAAQPLAGKVDFRCLRFPGLISAFTVPSGGTSDFAPEMIHAAAKGEAYACFVRPDTRIPFMAMPDAITALLQLAKTPKEKLQQRVYNVGAFAPTAEEIRQLVRQAFPHATLTYQVDAKRQAIVDSWPADVDDQAARRQWGFKPRYDLQQAFGEYLIPNIRRRYS